MAEGPARRGPPRLPATAQLLGRVLRHLAAPGAALAPARLDQALEALEVALHTALDEPELVARLLDETFGLHVELQHHARLVVTGAVERHHTRVLRPAGALPGDALVRALLGDLGLPLALLAGDVCLPVQVGVVELADLRHTLHELRELL